MTFEKEEKQCVVVCEDNKKVEEKKPAEVQLEVKKPEEKKVEEKKPMEKKPDEKCKSMMPCNSNYGGYTMDGQTGYSAY